ncbi:uncharacterized protein LOC132752795 [Ruditapes philippinarum]|uniref:uncharacterized protein LOC132752795 n=1 Tax=Ruditapes philippinarum TaxID=129788 RepID=UPI00295B238A|nr:uncharacterized protein LOC132752795 [Ruditapes philippinarum]
MYTESFIVLVSIGLIQANVCCFPKQYEANQGLMKATVKNGQLSILYGNLHYWFDGISKKELFIEDLTVDGYNTRVTVLKDYNVTNTKYVISGDRCSQKALTPFKEGCIPDWATKLVSSNYGSQNSGMNFNVYNNSAGSVTSFLISTQDCFPILDVSAIPHGASPYMQVVMPYNFTVGISDSSVFDIPAICKQSSLVGK